MTFTRASEGEVLWLPPTVNPSLSMCCFPQLNGGQLRYGFGGMEGLWPVPWTPSFLKEDLKSSEVPEVAGRPGASQGRDNSLLCRPQLCPCRAPGCSPSHSLSGDAEPSNELAERRGSGRWHHPPRHRLPYRSRLLLRLCWKS